MNIISAIGSFKGSIDSIEINETIKKFFEQQGHTVHAIPVADGGDGLLDSLMSALDGEYISIETENALGKPIVSKVGVAGNIGIVEMALASGLAILNENELNPLKTSTYGTGILIKHLAFSGIENIILGIGGSATNDGGLGCLSALGFEFYNQSGEILAPTGENLKNVYSISDKNVSEKIRRLNIQIACDVNNPLLGKNGATYIYSGQKGADENMMAVMEKAMENYSKVISDFCGKDYSEIPGTGAAGGLGFGLMALLGAKLQKGAEIVLQKAGYDEKLKSADLVLTGEGRLDSQTKFGKLPQIVSTKAKKRNVNCIALCGSSVVSDSDLNEMGMNKVYELINYAPFEKCMTETKAVIEKVLEDIGKTLD